MFEDVERGEQYGPLIGVFEYQLVALKLPHPRCVRYHLNYVKRRVKDKGKRDGYRSQDHRQGLKNVFQINISHTICKFSKYFISPFFCPRKNLFDLVTERNLLVIDNSSSHTEDLLNQID